MLQLYPRGVKVTNNNKTLGNLGIFILVIFLGKL